MPEKAQPGQVAEGVIDSLTVSYCIVVTVAVIVSTIIFSRFPITRADHEERVRKLAVASVTPAE
jgi:glycoside/pentoside/hexuronide:cation symporter, GPH family